MSRFRHHLRHGDLLGAHVSAAGGAWTIFERARAIGASSVALFSKNSNQWKAKNLDEEDQRRFKTAWQESGIAPVVIHAAYLINLAAVDPATRERSISAMRRELDRADLLGVPLVVLHPGSHMGAGISKGLERIARSFDRIHQLTPTGRAITLLETSAGQGSSLGCTFEELGMILKLVDDPARLGVCIDTCHIFSAGIDIRTRGGYDDAMDELETHVGSRRVGAFHLNDSKRELGSHVDRHEEIGKGAMGVDAFGFVLNDKRFLRIPKVIETPKSKGEQSDVEALALLRSLL